MKTQLWSSDPEHLPVPNAKRASPSASSLFCTGHGDLVADPDLKKVVEAGLTGDLYESFKRSLVTQRSAVGPRQGQSLRLDSRTQQLLLHLTVCLGFLRHISLGTFTVGQRRNGKEEGLLAFQKCRHQNQASLHPTHASCFSQSSPEDRRFCHQG